MTEHNKRTKNKRVATPLIAPPLLAEIRKGKGVASVTISGIVSITDLTSEEISLATHAGRVVIRGNSLTLVIFEGGVVEINGKIEGVSLGYAKN